MALTARRIIEWKGSAQDQVAGLFADSDIYYPGGLYIVDADGKAAVPSDTADLIPLGIFTGECSDGDRTDAKTISTSNTIKGVFQRGMVWLPFSGAAQSDVGEIFYVSADDTLTQTAGSKTVGLRALEFKTGYLLFDLRYYDRIA
jgi:hypothetical protein